MRIGQLAQLVGVETQTIRFYEQQGLLPPPDRQDNGYRVYTEKHGEGLAFIRRCRILGLSLVSMAINFDPLLANKIDPLGYR